MKVVQKEFWLNEAMIFDFPFQLQTGRPGA
jgi:hypothetical protein